MVLVIIAAGQGSRLRATSGERPKTLLPVGGKALLEQLIENACSLHLSEVVVVSGYRRRDLENYLQSRTFPLPVRIVTNPDWKSANGVSVLAARSVVPGAEPFLLSMSDHYYRRAFLQTVSDFNLRDYQAAVALDFKVDRIFDPDDAMKVKVDSRDPTRVTAMSKTLRTYHAVDCGVFKCQPAFFQALETAQADGHCRLSDACNELIAAGTMGGIDIGNQFWQDIDTPEAYQRINGILQ